jgi:hypothetical protein
MPGLVPGIHVLVRDIKLEDVDGRNKSGHDAKKYQEEERRKWISATASAI